MHKETLMTTKSIEIPDISKLGQLYQRAIEKDHQKTALSAEQAVLSISQAESSIAQARVLAAFLDEV